MIDKLFPPVDAISSVFNMLNSCNFHNIEGSRKHPCITVSDANPLLLFCEIYVLAAILIHKEVTWSC